MVHINGKYERIAVATHKIFDFELALLNCEHLKLSTIVTRSYTSYTFFEAGDNFVVGRQLS